METWDWRAESKKPHQSVVDGHYSIWCEAIDQHWVISYLGAFAIGSALSLFSWKLGVAATAVGIVIIFVSGLINLYKKRTTRSW